MTANQLFIVAVIVALIPLATQLLAAISSRRTLNAKRQEDLEDRQELQRQVDDNTKQLKKHRQAIIEIREQNPGTNIEIDNNTTATPSYWDNE